MKADSLKKQQEIAKASLDEKRAIVKASFMVGVNWLLKVLHDGDKADPGIWETFNETTVRLLRERAEKVSDSVVKS